VPTQPAGRVSIERRQVSLSEWRNHYLAFRIRLPTAAFQADWSGIGVESSLWILEIQFYVCLNE
jgi:hypothetical protein